MCVRMAGCLWLWYMGHYQNFCTFRHYKTLIMNNSCQVIKYLIFKCRSQSINYSFNKTTRFYNSKFNNNNLKKYFVRYFLTTLEQNNMSFLANLLQKTYLLQYYQICSSLIARIQCRYLPLFILNIIYIINNVRWHQNVILLMIINIVFFVIRLCHTSLNGRIFGLKWQHCQIHIVQS